MRHIVTVHAIVDAVAATTSLTRTDLRSDRRTAEIVEARHVVFWLARELTELSYQAIGAAVGNRDHSVVIDACRRVAGLRETNAEYRATTDALLGVLRALENNKLLVASTVADPLGTARRIIANPAREAMRVPIIEIVAMARLLAELLGENDSDPSETMETTDAA